MSACARFISEICSDDDYPESADNSGFWSPSCSVLRFNIQALTRLECVKTGDFGPSLIGQTLIRVYASG